LVTAPLQEADYPDSDALVAAGAGSVEAWVNSRPSMVRTVNRSLLPTPVRSVLVQRVDQLGDLVCSVPAIRRLRELFPDARLIGLVTPANAPLAERLGLFDEIVMIDFTESATERRRVLTLEAQDDLRRKLASHDLDIAIDLGEGDESRPLLLLSGAKFLYGFKDRQSPWLDAGLDFNAHDPVNTIEIVPPSRKMALLVEGLAAMSTGQAEPILSSDRADLAQLGLGANERYAVIHAGARLPYSRWPHFDLLARMLLERTDLKIVLFADDAAAARQAAEEAGHAARLHVIAGQMPFAEFDTILAHCAVFIGNDSGPKHLAALRGAPVVSLHMARLNWSEWGQEMTGRIISRRVPCAGCAIGIDGEDCGKDFACLRAITPEEVFGAVADVLRAND
jgi:ADP-heptose:LPS heptosyltransferase